MRWTGGSSRRERRAFTWSSRVTPCKVNGSGETIEALNLLFRVSDKFESSFDRKTGCSYGFSKQTIEGKRQVNTDLKFDYGQRKSSQQEKNLVSGITKREEAQIPGCVTDLLSGIFYALRNRSRWGKAFRCRWPTRCIRCRLL
jgi:hypothetical protein